MTDVLASDIDLGELIATITPFAIYDTHWTIVVVVILREYILALGHSNDDYTHALSLKPLLSIYNQ